MKKNCHLALIFFIISCSNEPDTKIICECYSEKSKRTYINSVGKYIQEPSCSSEMTGLINESDNKFQMKKNGWIFNFSRGRDESNFYVKWHEDEIRASGEDMNFDKVYLTLDRVNLKSYLLTRVLFDKPTELMRTTGVNIEQNFQCKVVEGV